MSEVLIVLGESVFLKLLAFLATHLIPLFKIFSNMRSCCRKRYISLYNVFNLIKFTAVTCDKGRYCFIGDYFKFLVGFNSKKQIVSASAISYLPCSIQELIGIITFS